MARTQSTRRMTRKGSKQLTDDKRASQVASLTRVASPTRIVSPTIPPGKIDGTIQKDPATLTAAKRKSQAFWTPEILQGAREVKEKRANMTEEERAIDIEKTRLSLGMLPIEIVRDMKENDRQRKERDNQRGKQSAHLGMMVTQLFLTRVKSTMTLMTMTTKTTNGTTTSSLPTATTTMAAITPITTTTPMTTTTLMKTATPMTNTLSQPMTRRQRRRTGVKEKPPQVPSGFPEMLTGHA